MAGTAAPADGGGAAGPSVLCRRCLALHGEAAGRCPACGSPRLVVHPELTSLAIAHLDCDAFYASIEKRDRPELVDEPVIVGGGRRGVVLTACYIARTYGIRSAMPMFKALQACPHARVVKPDMAKYVGVARRVRAMMEALTPAVEPLSVDEAFLDLRGTERLHHAPPAAVLAGLQARIERDLGITVSIGLSHNKYLAKIASDLDKPRGFALIGLAETTDFLAARPVSLIWGVGAAMQKRLEADGIRRIGQLQRLDEADLGRRYGAMGLRLARLSRGEDARPVVAERQAKTLSAESTFDTDLASAEQLMPHLRRLSEKVAARLKEKSLAGRTIVLKLKTRDFRIRTRTTRAGSATNLADRIYRTARDMLLPELDGTAFRLIGVGVAGLAAAEPEAWDDLLDPDAGKRARAEAAMDKVRSRFGPDGLALGLTFRPRPKTER